MPRPRGAPRRSAIHRPSPASTTSPTTVAAIPNRPNASIAAATAGRRQDRDHPETAVERRPELLVVEPAQRPEQAHDRGHRPALRVEPGGEPVGQRARDVPGQAAAGDVGQAVEVGARRRGPRPAPRGRPARRSGSGSAGPRRGSPSPRSGPPRSPRRPRRRRASAAAGPGTARSGRGPIARRAPGPASSRWQWSPDEARPRMTSPARTADPSMTSARSTTPMQQPDRSNASSSISPGCSAVSPPTSAQPASRQPAATEPTSSATHSGTTCPTAM